MNCPKCRSYNIEDLSALEPSDDDKATLLKKCLDCKCEWEELWVFDHIFKINDVAI